MADTSSANAGAPRADGDKSKEQKQDEENVWQQVLAKATRRNKSKDDTTLILLGDVGAGKSSLLKKFKERVTAKGIDQSRAQEYILDYSFCAVKNVLEDEFEDHGYINVWELEIPDQAANLLEVIIKPEILKSCVYAICVDLSQPWNIMKSLTKWIDTLKASHKKAFDLLPAAEQEQLKLSIAKYNQFYVDASHQKEAGAAKPSDADVKVSLDYVKENLGVPLIVIGCKGDLISQGFQGQNGVGDRFEYIARNLRKFCLNYGASLIFTSTVRAGVNVDVLQQYIYHRLYDFELRHPSKVVGSETEFGVVSFAGYDTADVISAFQPAKAAWKDDASFEEVFKAPEEAAVVKTSVEQEIRAEDTEVFLKNLRFKRDTAPASGASAALKRAPAGAAPGAAGADQAAVKDFFRSLLNTSGDKAGLAKPSPDKVKEAAKNITSPVAPKK